MKAYSEVEVMALRDKYQRTLADLENKLLFACESNRGRDFSMFGNVNWEYHPGMNQTVEKIWSYHETIATTC